MEKEIGEGGRGEKEGERRKEKEGKEREERGREDGVGRMHGWRERNKQLLVDVQ